MVKKMKLIPSLFIKHTEARSSSWPWPWPSCKHPRTLSFRASSDTPAESWFKNSSGSASFTTASEEDFFGGTGGGDVVVESVIRGLRRSTGRLFFEPGETSSILEETKARTGVAFKDSVVTTMESEDPYGDFRRSMEEMVEAHGLKEWERLEELFSWYLRANGRKNHGYIVGAFVDLLVRLASNANPNPCSCSSCSNSNSNSSPSTPLSLSSSFSLNTPCLSSLETEETKVEEEEEEEDNRSVSLNV